MRALIVNEIDHLFVKNLLRYILLNKYLEQF